MATNEAASQLSGTVLYQQIVLSQAIKKDDQTSIKKLLIDYPSKEDPVGRDLLSPLEIAIKYNRLEIIDLLISKGACVKAPLNWYKQNALHIAALHRNKKVILRILQSDADWNAVDAHGANVLHLVLNGGKYISSMTASYKFIYTSSITSTDEQCMIIDILKIFLDLGLDVNECTNYSESPLELAIKSGMIDVARFLIVRGADPYVCDRRGDGILHMLISDMVKQNEENWIVTGCQHCTENEILNFVKWMQSEGIEINTPNIYEVTPLQLAINLRLETMVPILTGSADNSFAITHDQSNLHVILAKYYNCQLDFDDCDEDITIFHNLLRKLLNDGADVNVVDNSGNTPFHIVAKQKDNQLIEFMLNYFTNVNAQNHFGETVLHIFISNSVANGNYERFYERYVYTLLSRGADVNQKNGKGMTPVQLAVQQKHAGIVKILADNGADLKVTTKDGDDLFHLLLRSLVEVNEPAAHKHIIDVLLKNGFDLEKPDNNGHTLLYQATMWGNLQLINALLEMGANVNYVDHNIRRLTPLHIAIQFRSMPVVVALMKFGANVNTRTKDGEHPLGMAVKKNDLTIVKRLLETGINANTVTQGNRPLILAVGKRNLELIKLLLHYGADVNLCDESIKLTPLHVAANTNQEDLVDLLIKSGANVNARNASEETPLHLAACHNSSMVESLVKAGAKIHLLDNKNRLPLHRTVESNNIVGLHYLLKSGQDINALGCIQFIMTSLLDNQSHTHDTEKATIIKHLTKFHVIDLLVPRLDNENYVQKPDDSFYRQCLDEVKKLKNQYICDRISVYDFMHMTPKSQLIHAKNVKFQFHSGLPNYNSLVKIKVFEALERKKLLELAKSAWYESTNIMLPEHCLENIFDYVKNDTLKIFIQSAEYS